MIEIEKYAKENKIPIMEKEGIDFLKKYIKDNHIKTILEIGSAIGYSAINMALIDKTIKITTVERDKDRYDEALKNISKFSLNNQIDIILDDALNIELKEKYDLIFIDAAKGQYIKFFEKFSPNLNQEGTIISDNLKFHGLVGSMEKIQSKNLRQLVRKIKEYIDFLHHHPNYETTIIDIGDGIGITKPRR